MVILISCDDFIIERFKTGLGDEDVKVYESYDYLVEVYQPVSEDLVAVDTFSTASFDVTKLKSSVLVLAAVPSFEEALAFVSFGIRGYANRMMMPANMAQAVNSVKSGQVWMPPDIISRLIVSMPQRVESNTDLSELTDRELEVAKLVADGNTNAEIAEQMNITVRTVKAHMTSIFTKTNLRDRVALALALK